MIVNSSPPRRVTVSVSRTHCFSRSAVCRSTSSPAAWPRLSLIDLEIVEIDEQQRERLRLPLRLRVPAGELILEIQAIRQRGQRVVVRLVVELLVLRRRREGDADAIAEAPGPRALLVGEHRRTREAQHDGTHDGVLPDDRQHEQRLRAELRRPAPDRASRPARRRAKVRPDRPAARSRRRSSRRSARAGVRCRCLDRACRCAASPGNCDRRSRC